MPRQQQRAAAAPKPPRPLSSRPVRTTSSAALEQYAARVKALGLNMLDADRVAAELVADANKEYTYLKQRSKRALARARDCLLGSAAAGAAGASSEAAAANIAHSYQMRVAADWVWKEVLGNKSDAGHARFVQRQIVFHRVASGGRGLAPGELEAALGEIARIKDWDDGKA